MSDWASRRLHFIGIGGAGMSGLALVCAELGATVSGSDRADSSYMERLRAAGLDPAVGHDAANLPEGAEVVVSTAIGDDNPELALARERGIEPIHRGALLAELCAEKRLIAVAGTHGKTTTTAMLVWALRALGADPAFFVGGEVPGLGRGGEAVNAGWGEGEWVIAEADESDASFLELKPEIAVVTNVEMDHHSRWGSVAELRARLRASSPPGRRVVSPTPGRHSRTSETRAGRARAPQPAQRPRRACGRRARPVRAPPPSPRRSPTSPGCRRRLELKGSRNGARIYDDYAHHPTEVRAALSALRELEPERLIAVFQPHLYSRTKAFAEELRRRAGPCRRGRRARRLPGPRGAGRRAGRGQRPAGRRRPRPSGWAGRRVCWLPDAPSRRSRGCWTQPGVGPGDILVTIGAGDIFKLGEALVEAAMAARGTR